MYVPNSNLINIDILQKVIVDNIILIGDISCKHKKWCSNSVNGGGQKLKENSYELGFKIEYMPKNYKKNGGTLDVINIISSSINRPFEIGETKP